MDDTGRESEVAQAEQVAVPKILSHNERASVDAAGFDSALSFQPHESTGNFSNVNATSVTSMSSTKSPVAKVDHIGLNNDINVDQVAPPVLKKGQLSDQEIQPEDNQIIRRGEEEKPEDTGNKPQMEEDEENHREIGEEVFLSAAICHYMIFCFKIKMDMRYLKNRGISHSVVIED